MAGRKLQSSFTFLIAALFMITSCNNTTDSDSGETVEKKVPIKMKLQTANQNVRAASVDSLMQVKMLVDELELESSIDNDSLDYEVEDLVVDLPLDGTELVLASTTIPEGTYDEFELGVDDPDDDSQVQDSDLIEGPDDDQRYSVFVRGIFEGQEFTYRSNVEFDVEMELNPPLIVDETGASKGVTILVDPYTWFQDSASGNALDPTDPANRETINQNIIESFGADLDDDDDNNDDGNNDDDSDD